MVFLGSKDKKNGREKYGIFHGIWKFDSTHSACIALQNILLIFWKKWYTDRNILDDSYQLVKHFLNFPLWEYTISSLKQKLLIKGSNSVLPEREIQEMFY